MKINAVLFVRIDVLIDGAPAGFKAEREKTSCESTPVPLTRAHAVALPGQRDIIYLKPSCSMGTSTCRVYIFNDY